MNLKKLLFTQNECYKVGKPLKVQGVMVHSTGANNPWLKRYVGPDDGLLGRNQYGNHWNQARPEGRQICVHAFIGKLADGSIATYQTLPWNMRGWHGASGAKGSVNNTHIGFEICEDDTNDPVYFNKVYKEATELVAYLCGMFDLDPMADGVVICHSEGYKRGIASNHADVMHWFPKHGKNMDIFRADVAALLKKDVSVPPAPQPPAFVPYIVKINNANIRKEPTGTSPIVGTTGIGSFTIVGEQNGFGKLKSGAGWVKLDWKDKPSTELKKGDLVNFAGGKHYTSSTGNTGYRAKAGPARITAVNKGSKHPFHIVSTNTKVTNVYGWVDANTITRA